MIEDNSLRSNGYKEVNLDIGYHVTPKLDVKVSPYNLFNSHADAIDYAYDYRLTPTGPEQTGATFHPPELLLARFEVTASFLTPHTRSSSSAPSPLSAPSSSSAITLKNGGGRVMTIEDQTLFFASNGLETRHAFPTPVLLGRIEAAARVNDALRAAILARRDTHPGVQRSNEGGWQSTDDLADWAGPEAVALIALARRMADHHTAVAGEGGAERREIGWTVNAWANINAPGDTNRAHHHPGAFWSGVYWVDVEEGQGGEFEMLDPRGILPGFMAPTLRYAVPGCLSAGGSDFIAPRAGTMMLFPSWLVHAVRPYRGSGPRISIAFNLKP